MTISAFSSGSYATQLTASRLSSMKSQFDTLSTQLTTGRTSETYGGLGAGRLAVLNAQAQISAIDGTSDAITNARTRLSVTSASMTQVTKLVSTATSTLSAQTAGKSQTGLTTRQTGARQQLAASLDALGQSAGGAYVFGGRSTDSSPVADVDLIMDGDPSSGLTGLSGLISERKAADGVGGTGNLAVGVDTTAGTVSLSEPASGLSRANLGFTIGSVTSSNASALSVTKTAATAPTVQLGFAQQPKDGDTVRVTVNQPDGSQKLVDYTARTSPTPGSTTEFQIGADAATSAANLNGLIGSGTAVAGAQSGSPPGVTLKVTNEGVAGSASLAVGTPSDGDTITIQLGLHDGTTTSITLTAKTTPDPSDPTQFAIGGNAGATATNLQSALSSTLQNAAGTTLSAASATLASQDFFAGSSSPGLSPRRIGTVTYTDAQGVSQTAQSFLTATDGKSVTWYTGDDGPGDARATASVQLGAGYSVGFGVRANEPAIQSALAGLGALANESFTVESSSATQNTKETARYTALASRVGTLLSPPSDKQSLEQIGTELGLADATLSNAQTQNASTKNILQGTIDNTESISTESVATQITALQNQLQASYQVTSMLAKLSLVNYL